MFWPKYSHCLLFFSAFQRGFKILNEMVSNENIINQVKDKSRNKQKPTQLRWLPLLLHAQKWLARRVALRSERPELKQGLYHFLALWTQTNFMKSLRLSLRDYKTKKSYFLKSLRIKIVKATMLFWAHSMCTVNGVSFHTNHRNTCDWLYPSKAMVVNYSPGRNGRPLFLNESYCCDSYEATRSINLLSKPHTQCFITTHYGPEDEWAFSTPLGTEGVLLSQHCILPASLC